MNISTLTIDDQTFEIAPEEHRISVEYIERVWRKVGRPTHLEGESAWKVVDAMMQVWGALYPHEIHAWRENIKEERAYERTPHEAEKANGGHFPIAYPTRIYEMLKVKFPTTHFADRDLVLKFIERYPFLKVTKYKL